MKASGQLAILSPPPLERDLSNSASTTSGHSASQDESVNDALNILVSYNDVPEAEDETPGSRMGRSR
jgi:hypothetical protein